MSFNLEQFIQKAQQRESSKLKYAFVHVDYFDMDIPLKKIGMEKCFEFLDGIDEDNTLQAIKAQKELIYESMPILQSDEVQSLREKGEPFDIVLEIFNVDEISKIVDRISVLNGINVEIEDVKNLSEQTLEHTTDVCS